MMCDSHMVFAVWVMLAFLAAILAVDLGGWYGAVYALLVIVLFSFVWITN